MHYLKAIESKQLIFATAKPGVEVLISAAKAAEALIHKDVERMIVTRSVLQADEDLASYLEISQKSLLPFSPGLLRGGPALRGFLYAVLPVTEIGKVEIAPFAYTRGRTFENAVVILDEAQNVTAAQMKMFLTRLGENVTVIVNGDYATRFASRRCSGLSDALERLKKMKWLVLSGSVRGLRMFGTLPTYAACIQLSVLSVQSPGEWALFWCLCPD
ncbi:PhoH family protein [Shigella flexneri]